MNAPAVLGGAPAFPEGLALTHPLLPDRDELLRGLADVLDSGRLTHGAVVEALEEAAAAQLGVRHVVAVASCTSGLMLVLQACGATGRVVVPSFTFAATAHAAHWAGGTPAFADVEPATLTLDPVDAATRTEGASAIVATHLYGSPCQVEELEAVAQAAGIPLVFDAAHALGSLRQTIPVGRFGAAEVFSLSPTKIITGGEGGLVATDDDAIAEACRIGRDYGNSGDYDCRFPGLNARMSELHASLALAALPSVPARVARRNQLVERFASGIAQLPGLRIVRPSDGDVSTYKDLAVVVDEDQYGLDCRVLATALAAEGIDTRRYYYPPVHMQKAYATLGPTDGLTVTDQVAHRVLCPPLWSQMSETQIDRLADAFCSLHARAPAVRRAVA